ncbi:MAG: hypothetical protein QOG26_1534, partial [Solirubrobacterales bacterium]|nr:hypothetical protein [Solirubrobacterales bacterium]
NPRLTRVRDESGMTVFEVLVAAIILVIGALATFQIFDAAARNKYRTEQRQVGLDRAQREIEKLRDIPYAQLALSTYPSSSSNVKDPRYRVHGTDFALNANGSGDEAMVVNGGSLYGGGQVVGGTVDPAPQHFISGDVSGDVFRFIVWIDDPNCFATCPGSQDLKRVVVVVKLDAPAQTGQRSYVETQSDFIDPKETALSDLPAGPNGAVTAQQFYLSDTVCPVAGATNRANITADHLLHNTMGSCLSGLHTGTTTGAPDALLTSSPPDPFPLDTTLPASFDYANDAILEPSPNTDKGLQLLRQDSNGCSYSPAGANPQAKIHRWVTDAVPLAFSMSGNATFEFYTQTINDAVMDGKVCVYLFVRNQVGPVVTDTRLLDSGTGNAYFTYSPVGGGNWPSGAWTKVRLNMQFPPTTTLIGQRVGVALSVDRSETATDGLQFLYDHPDDPSRLEVDTTTPLGG